MTYVERTNYVHEHRIESVKCVLSRRAGGNPRGDFIRHTEIESGRPARRIRNGRSALQRQISASLRQA